MGYTFEDVTENAIGCISATLFFFMLKGGTPGPFIDPVVGMGISAVWLFLLYSSFERKNGRVGSFVMAVVVSATICTFLSIVFGLASWSQMNTLTSWMGSPAMLTTLMAVPVAIIFEKMNLKSVLSRYYVKGK